MLSYASWNIRCYLVGGFEFLSMCECISLGLVFFTENWSLEITGEVLNPKERHPNFKKIICPLIVLKGAIFYFWNLPMKHLLASAEYFLLIPFDFKVAPSNPGRERNSWIVLDSTWGNVGILPGRRVCSRSPKIRQGSLPFSAVTRNRTCYGHTLQDWRLAWWKDTQNCTQHFSKTAQKNRHPWAPPTLRGQLLPRFILLSLHDCSVGSAASVPHIHATQQTLKNFIKHPHRKTKKHPVSYSNSISKLTFSGSVLVFFVVVCLFVCFWSCLLTCRILVPWPGIEPVSPCSESPES